jgi:uncharacterized membrane protein
MKNLMIILLILLFSTLVFTSIIPAKSGFNIIPYTLFVIFTKNPSEGNEQYFIYIFDALFSLALVYFIYKKIISRK